MQPNDAVFLLNNIIKEKYEASVIYFHYKCVLNIWPIKTFKIPVSKENLLATLTKRFFSKLTVSEYEQI